MRLVADENIDGRIVTALRDAGHEVIWIAQTMGGARDPAVLETARTSRALPVTDDLDFGELVFRQRRAAFGALLLRLAGMPVARKVATVVETLNAYGHELEGQFGVLDLRQLRIRPLGP